MYLRICSTLVCLLLVCSFSTPIYAQELRPLREVFESSANPYKYSRCAGFYLSMLEWMGEERMGAEMTQQTKASYTSLAILALTTMESDGVGTDYDHLLEIFQRDARNIADLYLNRFERNYATVGQAFGEDTLVLDDLDLCSNIVQLFMNELQG